MAGQRESTLLAYEVYVPSGSPRVERLFRVIFAVVLTVFLGFALFLRTVEPQPEIIAEKIARIKARLLIREMKPEPQEEARKKQKKVGEKPADLTKRPELKQKEKVSAEPPPAERKVRRVYGLRKVYARGLGTGGSLSDAVIGKLGNTIDKEVDTLTATSEEVEGRIVSATTITQAPRLVRRVKPEYSEEMLKNRIEGTISVRVLVDVDGRVKKAQALNDLGFGSKELAVEACRALRFEPAMRGTQAVAVWIVVPITFKLLG